MRKIIVSNYVTLDGFFAGPNGEIEMNNSYKFVFSRTLDRVEWNNSRLLTGNVAEEAKKLKQWDGQDIVIYGSGSIVRALTALGLIDEYRIFVNPVILGKGKPLFVGDRPPIPGDPRVAESLRTELRLLTRRMKGGLTESLEKLNSLQVKQ